MRRQYFHDHAVGDGKISRIDIYAVDALVIRHIGRHTNHLNRLRNDFPRLQAVIGTDAELQVEQQFLGIASYINRGVWSFNKNFAQRCGNTKTKSLGKLPDGCTVG